MNAKHHVHLIQPKSPRSIRPIIRSTPDLPPAPPSFITLLAQTKHQPTKETLQ